MAGFSRLSNKLRAPTLLGAACLVVYSLLASIAHGEEPNQAQLQARMQTLQGDIKQLQSWLKKAQQQSSQLNQKLAHSEQQIGSLSQQLKQSQAKLSKLKAKNATLQEQASQLQDSLFEQEQALAQHLRHQYQTQQRQQTGLLFSLTDASDASRMMSYFRYLHQAQAEQLAAYRNSLETLNLVQQQQADTQLALEQEIHQLEQRQGQLKQARQDQQQAISQLRKQQQSKSQKLAASKAAKQQAQDLLEQLEIALKKAQTQAQGQPFAKQQGRLSWPLQGKVLNRFGTQQSAYPLSEHGWLIKAQAGSDVQAVHAGQVVFANWLKGYGLLMILDHGDGFLTLYGQNQSLYREVGAKVSAGELIASSGKSGGQQHEALYFSIRRDGQPQNPARWLSR